MAQPYVAGPVERFGRRIKLEYVGMISVYLIIWLLFFGNQASLGQAALATIGSFFLFLGLKKKTRDHLSGSMLLFAAALLARGPLAEARWAVPYMLFGACVCALEGYLEKRQEQMFALPVLFAWWGWLESTWLPALAFAALYLTHPWKERPGLRRRLSALTVTSTVSAFAGTSWRLGAVASPVRLVRWQRLAPARADLLLLAAIGIPALLCLAFYWQKLAWPHRLGPLLFAMLGPWDLRLLALSGMAVAVLLSATVFRLSIDSDRLRPLFKHAEWHYFWYVFAVAMWVGATALH